ncbi:MAG: hypothetical protein UW73_C0029G0008 [Microgenomates group bacterium GW2011_GWB1_44_8]|nr:MAG: hypothetical protein UW73_C0029G0008 [Microgenomates group bacterium GW2011_GWB1_44_8]
MQKLILTKSKFKPQVLAYLRMVENEKKELVITHDGKPTVKVVPYEQSPERQTNPLLKTVTLYKDPVEPIDEKVWERLK